MISVFNEEEYAQKMIKNGFLSRKYRFELKVLAKYYLFSEKVDINHIKPILVAFCERFLSGFNMHIHYEMINATISYLTSKKCKYIILDGVFVSDEFVQYFLGLDESEDVRKFLFTLAIFGRINEQIGYGNEYIPSFNDYRDVKASAGIKIDGSIYVFMKPLRDKGFLDMNYKSVIRILFLDKIPTGEPIYKIKDFKNLGLWLDFYQNKNGVHLCEKCGKLFKKRNPKAFSQKYCSSCSPTSNAKVKTNNKSFICIDCKKIFFASNKSKTDLCKKCYLKYRKEYKKRLNKKQIRTGMNES